MRDKSICFIPHPLSLIPYSITPSLHYSIMITEKGGNVNGLDEKEVYGYP
jgi:hypothetical protein